VLGGLEAATIADEGVSELLVALERAEVDGDRRVIGVDRTVFADQQGAADARGGADGRGEHVIAGELLLGVVARRAGRGVDLQPHSVGDYASWKHAFPPAIEKGIGSVAAVPLLVANVMAVAVTAILNFLAADLWVFSPKKTC